jgi:uncharacterized membrane protein YkvA (DUF1232 family)
VAVSLLIAVGVVVALYAGLLALLFRAGRGTDARAIARLVPDCLVLARRLLGDPGVPLRHKLALAGLIAYVVMPIDLVPDFLPVIGHLDDAILVALVLRGLVRASGPELVRRHWPGSARGLDVVLWLAYSPGGWRTT